MNQSETLLPKHLEDSLGIALKNSKSLSNINQGFPGLLEHHTNENVKAFPFHSNIGAGSGIGSIRLGAHKRHHDALREFKSSFTYHDDIPQKPENQQPYLTNEYQPSFPGGLSTTKFNKGFQRRMQSDISNELKEKEKATLAEISQRKAMMSESRRETLDKMRFANGYNLISGEMKTTSGNCTIDKPRGKKHLSPSVSTESIINGMNYLRESMGRFHMPHSSGETFDKRQETLYMEGTYAPRMTRVLGKLIPSYGIEDQFSKSDYDKLSKGSKFGLYETRKPGEYTPRKQPGNPSGDNNTRAKWTNTLKIG